jgi:hypothetical protein
MKRIRKQDSKETQRKVRADGYIKKTASLRLFCSEMHRFLNLLLLTAHLPDEIIDQPRTVPVPTKKKSTES